MPHRYIKNKLKKQFIGPPLIEPSMGGFILKKKCIFAIVIISAMLMKKFVLMVVALWWGVGAMAQSASPVAFPSVSAEVFAQRIAEKRVVVVDVRTAKEFAEGHIDGAINVVWDANFETHLEAANIGKKKTVAVYCRSGRRSKAAAQVLVAKGYRVVELGTGYIGWQQWQQQTTNHKEQNK